MAIKNILAKHFGASHLVAEEEQLVLKLTQRALDIRCGLSGHMTNLPGWYRNVTLEPISQVLPDWIENIYLRQRISRLPICGHKEYFSKAFWSKSSGS